MAKTLRTKSTMIAAIVSPARAPLTKFERLSRNTHTLIGLSEDCLNCPRRGISTLSVPGNVANSLGWNVEDWMKASHTLAFAGQVAHELELAILDSLSLDVVTGWPDASFDEKLDAKADEISKMVRDQAMARLLRFERPNCPMSILKDSTERYSVMKVMDALGRSSRWSARKAVTEHGEEV